MSRFSSVFASKLEAMLEYRTALGYKEKSCLPTLIRFDKFCIVSRIESPELTRDIVHDWLDGVALEEGNLTSPATAIRQLAKYLNAIGEDAYVLPERFSPKKSKFTPYIFTDGELTALFCEIDKLVPNKREPFMTEIAPVLFRLIYTCGLRPNEGRELERENINFDTGEVLITHTKRNRERVVVMSDDMLNLCRKYDRERNIFGGNSRYFFPAGNGEAFVNGQIAALFTKTWTKSVISPSNPVPKSVRVYDLRHRFASACLNRWLDEGRDLMVMLPYLRAYMGHNKLSDTAYYIHLLPENLVKTATIDWDALNSIIPEVSACPN